MKPNDVCKDCAKWNAFKHECWVYWNGKKHCTQKEQMFEQEAGINQETDINQETNIKFNDGNIINQGDKI